jgi:hypothetical protein
VSFCCDLIGDLDLAEMRSVRASVRGREGGRVFVGRGCCDTGSGILTSSVGSGRGGSG